ncbi:iron-containing alcohol dehydrogenase family protein, partial [Enterococcus faecium]
FYYGTTVLEKMAGYLHGGSVSYGVLALLMMDQQFDLFDKIYEFMKKNQLPVSLTEMYLNVTTDLEASLDKAMTTNEI